MQRIPISPSVGAQSFRITLNKISYTMTARWNDRAEFWTLDIADENQIAIINGIALKSGLDLLSPFNIGMGGLYVVNGAGEFVEATFTNINIDSFLMYLTPEENDG